MICNKHLTYEHIGYTAKSIHRTRRLDAKDYRTLEDVEEWKRLDTLRFAQEDQQQAEAKKKDEAEKAEEALARGDVLDLGEDVVMPEEDKDQE